MDRFKWGVVIFCLLALFKVICMHHAARVEDAGSDQPGDERCSVMMMPNGHVALGLGMSTYEFRRERAVLFGKKILAVTGPEGGRQEGAASQENRTDVR